MSPEKLRLIHELMNDGDEETRRAETLLAGGRVLRRRRRVRHAARSLVVLCVAAFAMLGIQRWTNREAAVVSKRPNASPSVEGIAQIHRLSDEELLALFPNTPVGLATLSDGRKRLIFPRPGDEARFITHL
jgi:hypothetical protein